MPSEDRDNTLRRNAVKRYRQSMIAAVTMLLLTLAATAWGWRTDRLGARRRAEARFHQEIDRTGLTIRARLELYEDALYGARSLFEANPNVTRAVFREYIENLELEKRYPGIQGIGYSERISHAKKAEFVARIRREGFTKFNIRPDGDRKAYTSIIYLEPFNWRNQRAFGYDMFSEPVRRTAMEYARDHNSANLSGKVKLLQETETDVQSGFLMYLPFYGAVHRPESVEQRREAIVGYVYAPFRMGDFLSKLISDADPLSFFEVYSGQSTTQEFLMYRSPELVRAGAGYKPAVEEVSTIQFGGQTWSIRFLSSPAFDAAVREGEHAGIVPAGVAIGILLFGVMVTTGLTDRRAVRLAESMTAQLRESEERVRAITQTASDAIISADANGNIVFFNPAAERMFGRSLKDVLGQPASILMPSRLHAAHEEALKHFHRRADRALGTPTEMVGVRADGSEFPVLASLSTWEANGVFFTGILHDISKRKAAEANIIKLNEELTEALHRSEKLAITGRLIATIAHEINNPLEALMNLLYVMDSNDALDERTRQFVHMAQDQVALLTNISRQTLSPYREGKFPSVTNISELLDDVLSMLRPKLLKTNVQVVRRYPSSVELTIYASELRQVFTNLAANAIDAMSGGGRLTVDVKPAQGGVNISISDNGCGIPPEHMQKVFEPFFTTKGDNGTGVGLWVVREIVNKLGGSIEVSTSTDANDHGTMFTIWLPANVADVKESEQPHAMAAGA